MPYANDNGIALDGKLRPLTSLALHLLSLIIIAIRRLVLFSFNRGSKEKEVSNYFTICSLLFSKVTPVTE